MAWNQTLNFAGGEMRGFSRFCVRVCLCAVFERRQHQGPRTRDEWLVSAAVCRVKSRERTLPSCARLAPRDCRAGRQDGEREQIRTVCSAGSSGVKGTVRKNSVWSSGSVAMFAHNTCVACWF